MPRLELSLIGLLEETILPGEERTILLPAIDSSTLSALSLREIKRLCAICITSRVELPSLVGQRFGTECSVISVEQERLVLRGERRIKVIACRGKESPYLADVEVDDAPLTAQEEWRSLTKGGHALFAALEHSASIESPEVSGALTSALAAVLRALSSKGDLQNVLKLPLSEALTQTAESLYKRSLVSHASCQLEASLRALSQRPELPKPLMHRLWSQVVEVQKRLDVYDPLSAVEEGGELAKVQKRLEQAGLPMAARQIAKRQLKLLRGTATSHHDYPTFLSQLQFMARLPWHPEPRRSFDLDAVEAILERDHAGLQRPKQRILEHLAVQSLGGEARSTVLCLVGPPGVGKTSLARSIAEALARPFIRVALGGVHDESEIRGHRLTFVAASPGRILNGIARVGSASPVMLLDEIDKIGTERQRSPAASLLEVLDPEQNAHFYDNFLGVPYDLSHVFFICTANDLSQVPEPLRDRLEIIELEGYTANEKAEISRRHLFSRLKAEHGLPEPLSISEDALSLLIEGHTREAGVRQLTRALASVHRARALSLVRKKEARPPLISSGEVSSVLGPARYTHKTIPEKLPVGMVTGLSVSGEGGSLLFIEVVKLPGQGELKLTGRLGEVFQESARAALTHLRAEHERYGVSPKQLQFDFHVHVPEAATPKDGPSAGVSLFLAFLSSVLGRPIPANVAMTGELTLNGSVLAVGGIRAKLLAAERAGVKRVFLPEANAADVPPELKTEVILCRDIPQLVRAIFSEIR